MPAQPAAPAAADASGSFCALSSSGVRRRRFFVPRSYTRHGGRVSAQYDDDCMSCARTCCAEVAVKSALILGAPTNHARSVASRLCRTKPSVATVGRSSHHDKPADARPGASVGAMHFLRLRGSRPLAPSPFSSSSSSSSCCFRLFFFFFAPLPFPEPLPTPWQIQRIYEYGGWNPTNIVVW
jgi:hypothetical protein